jgi:hypothetical protein
MFKKIAFCCLFIIMNINITYSQQISGELKKWHKVTLDFEGPTTSELAQPNPFTYYRLDVTFTHESGAPILTIPGFYATDGNAQNTSATSGKVWRVHFAPEKTGKWNYAVSFKAGENIVLKEGGVSAGFMDGTKGSFNITATDKPTGDNRGKGRLDYVGTRYLRYQENKEFMLKAGADSPENMLHFSDFDGTLDGYGKLGKDYLQLMKDWQPHSQDIEPSMEKFTWKNGKGKNLMGAINYLASKGMNAFSFLTFSVDGDDGCVYPHLLKNDSLFIQASRESKAWEKALIHDRFDVSKMAQWEQIFEYAETKGMFLHFKTFENESASTMGRDYLSDERKLYYRELIARFGHHLALNWNLSEETNVDISVVKNTASYIHNLDPYKHHLVQHTFPPKHGNGKLERPNFVYYYYNLVGYQSELTGASLQLQKKEIHEEVKKWIELSDKSGKPWVVCNDEQGEASDGVTVDAEHPSYKAKLMDNVDEIREKVLWATLMAGGMGVEYYYGYQCETNDLNNQDHRSRAKKYEQAKMALDFFRKLPFTEMTSLDELTENKKDYVFGKNGSIYAIYIPKNEKVTLSLLGNWSLQWFNPRNGEISSKQKFNNKITQPDTHDWVVLLTKSN